MNKKLIIGIALCSLLAACGGGSGSSTSPIPVVSSTPTQAPVFPKSASGHPMAFYITGQNTRTSANIRAMEVTPSPSPTASGSPSPTPLPTAAPLPTPSGNPFAPTRAVLGTGYDAQIVGLLNMEVTDGNGTVLPEASPPAMLSEYVSRVNIASVTPSQSIANAWAAALTLGQVTPNHTRIAATFADSVGIVDVYTYDAFYINCEQDSSVTTASGLASGGGTAPDVTLTNCPGDTNLSFPYGFMVVAPAQPDVFGQVSPGMNNLLAAKPFVSEGTTIAASQLAGLRGQIIQAKDSLGGEHKYMIVSVNMNTNRNTVDGVTMLHLSADVTGAFPF